MRKRYFIILSVIIAFSLESCTDWLNIKPESEIVLDDYWQNEAQAQAELTACYRGFTANTDKGENTVIDRFIAWGELRSDNLIEGIPFSTNRTDMEEILNVNIKPSNKYCEWGSIYSIINNCNTFLHYAPGVLNSDANFTAGKLHSMEAEALTLRALCYFYLVRAFKEVPWIDTPSIDDTQDYSVPKSSERVILDHIIADLLTAQKSARIDFGTTAYNKGFITLNAVNTLLADVYLWDQQYSNCVDMCNLVLADQTLKLVPGVSTGNMYMNVFYRGNSTESIFELQFDEKVQRNYSTMYLYGISGSIQGELSFPMYLEKGDFSPFNYKVGTNLESSTDKDTRYKDFINQNMGSLTGIYSIFKYAGITRTEDQNKVSTYSYRYDTPNWIVYRLSDVMLMKAEALVAPDAPSDEDMKEALAMVNNTYQRANPTDNALDFSAYNNKSDLEKLVLRERQRELMFEGKRWFDLMRLARRRNTPAALISYISPKLLGNVLGFTKMSVMDALYFPIPKVDIDNNPNLVQNPFYDESTTSN
jgi:hypothetical protein